MNDTVSILQDHRATISVTRKVTPKQYESLEVGIFLPVDLPERLETDTDESYNATVEIALRAGFTLAKVQVYDQLGLEYTDNEGVIAERVAASFPNSTVSDGPPPRPKDAAASAPTSRPTQTATGAASPSDGMSCPKCHGAMWDNTRDKKNPRAPDWKCKDKSCDGVIWPPKGK